MTGLAQRVGEAMFQASLETFSGVASMKPPILPPLEKCSPTERTTMTRTRASSSSVSNTRRSWSRSGLATTLSGGRLRMMSARSCASSISTWKPSSLASLGSAKVYVEAIVSSFLLIRSRVFRLIVAGHQQAAQQFSDRGFRQRIDKDETPRALEIGKARGAAKLIEFGFADLCLAFDKGGDDLAPFLVGKADDGDLEHSRVQRKTAFDFDRGDVFATGDDHVVDAAGDEEIAFAVNETRVAGKVPSLAQRLRIRVRPQPVALEGFIARQQSDDFALFFRRGKVGHGSCIQLYDADFLIDPGLARRTRLGRGVLVDSEGVDFGTAVMIDE